MMNIEEILPELFGEKRVYYCQRCLNHGLREKRKNHKLNCIYRFCQCSDCIMVERRRQLNSRLMQIDSSTIDGQKLSSSSEEDQSIECSSQPETASGDEPDGRPKERRPNCQRCAQHSVVNRLKGHKRSCPFRDCYCAKCQVVVERQKLMADQIKLRRRQKREKSNLHSEKEAPERKTDSPCVKCTQQAIGYQQLLSLLDPQASTDPMITLSAILAVCPHKNE